MDKEGPPEGYGADQRVVVLLGMPEAVTMANHQILDTLQARARSPSPASPSPPGPTCPGVRTLCMLTRARAPSSTRPQVGPPGSVGAMAPSVGGGGNKRGAEDDDYDAKRARV